MVATNLMPLVERLRRYAEEGHRIADGQHWPSVRKASETSNAARGSLSFAGRCRETLGV
jgi:hypothetical protein